MDEETIRKIIRDELDAYSRREGDIRSWRKSNYAGFFGTSQQSKRTVTGSKGANAALTSLLAALVAYGLISDTTS